MSDGLSPSGNPASPRLDETRDDQSRVDEAREYEIRVMGWLDGEWTDWLGGLTITPQANGDTLLNGPIVDQAALYGLLRKLRDLGMTLVSVSPIDLHRQEASASEAPREAPESRERARERERE